MANALNTLNLLQVRGGVNLKQGDVKSVLEYELGYTDDSDFMTDPKLDGKVAKVTLYNRHTNKKWTTETVVKGNRVSFTIDVPLEIGVYALDIDVEGHIFPSDRDAYVRVHEGYGSYMDGKAAIALVASAKNVADEAIRLAVLDNADKIRGPQGEATRVVSNSYDSEGNTIISFSNGGPKVTVQRGKQGKKGDDSKVISSTYDSEGNTVITFNNGSPTVTIKRGKPGKKGDTGNPVNVASVTKSGTTNTVKFTDGKTMKVEDGKSVGVSSSRILSDGNTEITFTDGKTVTVKKGQDGNVKFAELTEEQRRSLKGKPGRDGVDGKPGADGKSFTFNDLTSSQKEELRGKPGRDGVDGQPGKDGKAFKFEDLTEEQKRQLVAPVVNDLTTGGKDKALSAEQGKVLFQYANDGKEKIAKAIVGKGGEANKKDSFDVLAGKIDKIKSGYGIGDIIDYEKIKVMIEDRTTPKKIWESESHGKKITNMVADSKGNVFYIDTDQYAFQFDNSGKKSIRLNTTLKRSVVVDSEDNIYVGGRGELEKYSNEDKSMEWRLVVNNSINNGYIYRAYIDIFNIIAVQKTDGSIGIINTDTKYVNLEDSTVTLFGIRNKNVFTFRDYRVYVYEALNRDSNIWSVSTDEKIDNAIVSKNGDVYCFTKAKTLIKISNIGKIIWKVTANFNTIRSLSTDSKDSVYINDDKGVKKISASGEIVWDLPCDINYISTDEYDNIFVANGDKVLKYRNNGQITVKGYKVLQ